MREYRAVVIIIIIIIVLAPVRDQRHHRRQPIYVRPDLLTIPRAA